MSRHPGLFGGGGGSSGNTQSPSRGSTPSLAQNYSQPLLARNAQQPPPPPPPNNSRQGGGHVWHLTPVKSPDNSFTFRNLVAVSSQQFGGRDDIPLIINGQFVVSARATSAVAPGTIGLSSEQRTWMTVALTDTLQVEPFDLFAQHQPAYLGSIDIEIGFATRSKTVEAPYDQDDLAKEVVKIFQNQIFAPGQRFMMDIRSIPLILVVKTVQLVDLSEKASAASSATSSDPSARGILTPHTLMNFFKDPRTPLNLRASSHRPAPNTIIAPNFKFEDMGIGGLDAEFNTMFRRAFASRVFPPGLVEKLGIPHVKGILLYGPPGTGKTLIARQIGKMLNAREPKVINGPEVLNKYVGQSEENIRKMFADAEKEYKEKGDESGLHIIIFDELDAVCRQRGSGSAGGTGVGDNIVNQLLTKLDGVDQLNNILLIGMTNRKDLIDEALMRPGRLELHLEISLPDEHGRLQILKIHTAKMKGNNVMDSDVDLEELARATKNFSGAEIGGLIKSATSFAFNRHVKIGTVAEVSSDVANLKVNRSDFEHALEEVKPAYGVSEEELANCLRGGIIHFSSYIDDILHEGKLFVDQVRKPKKSSQVLSVCVHGPVGSGTTALAAQIANESGFPFIKIVSTGDMLGFSEARTIEHLTKVFTDAYKSPLSVIVLDSIERLVEWVPIGPRFSNPILQTLKRLLRQAPPKERRLLILATTSKEAMLEQLDIWNDFNADVPVSNVRTFDELAHVMEATGAFDGAADVQRAIAEIRQLTGGRSETVNVGIKKVLVTIETARMDTDMAGWFANAMANAMKGASGSHV